MRFFLILFFYTLVLYPQSNDPLIDADPINQKNGLIVFIIISH